jgi:hypothetical protein
MPVTRQRLLKLLNESEVSILVVVLDKAKVYSKLQNEKVVLYNYITNILLSRLFTKRPVSLTGKIILVASQRETNNFLNENFKQYISNQAKENHRLNIEVEIKTPAAEKALQITDFACWAIYRKYEFGDDSYYNIIISKIIEESPLYP